MAPHVALEEERRLAREAVRLVPKPDRRAPENGEEGGKEPD
jgi:hypothetical protein